MVGVHCCAWVLESVFEVILIKKARKVHAAGILISGWTWVGTNNVMGPRGSFFLSG